jgi:hypothetical protein
MREMKPASRTIASIASSNLLDIGDAQPGETAPDARTDLLRQRPTGIKYQPASEDAPIPRSLAFAPSIDPNLKIVKPFTVRVERCETTTAALAEEIEEFGYGDNISEALHDLGKTIAELYFSLEQHAANLGPGLQSLKTKLYEHIRRVRP